MQRLYALVSKYLEVQQPAGTFVGKVLNAIRIGPFINGRRTLAQRAQPTAVVGTEDDVFFPQGIDQERQRARRISRNRSRPPSRRSFRRTLSFPEYSAMVYGVKGKLCGFTIARGRFDARSRFRVQSSGF
jgi:hypothetical protein